MRTCRPCPAPARSAFAGFRFPSDVIVLAVRWYLRFGLSYRAIDQFGQVIDVFVSSRRDATAARRFLDQAISATRVTPIEVATDQAPVYPAVLEELLPAAWHRTEQDANNGIECDHGRLTARLRPMRGLKQDRSARAVVAGHASCRTCGVAITSWRSRSQRTGEWPWRSTNWPR